MKQIVGNWPAAACGMLKLDLNREASIMAIHAGANTAPHLYRIGLDSAGSVPAGQQIWGNDELYPNGTQYFCTFYDRYGELIWGPQALYLCGNSPFDLNRLVRECDFPTVSSAPEVSITPASAVVPSGYTVQFTATVSGMTAPALNWNAPRGVINQNGLYTAHAVDAEDNLMVSVDATDITGARATVSAQASVTVVPLTGGAIVNQVSYAGQSNSIADTSLITAATAGIYRVAYYHECARAAVNYGSSQLNFHWNDGYVQQWVAITPLGNVVGSFQQGEVIVFLGAGQALYFNASYASSPAGYLYDLSITVENLASGITVPPQPPAGVSVAISPTSANVASAGTQQFTAVVSNATNSAVTWSATQGSVANGLFTAPSVANNTTVTVTATSVQDPTKSASATVTVTGTVITPPPPTYANLETLSPWAQTAGLAAGGTDPSPTPGWLPNVTQGGQSGTLQLSLQSQPGLYGSCRWDYPQAPPLLSLAPDGLIAMAGMLYVTQGQNDIQSVELAGKFARNNFVYDGSIELELGATGGTLQLINASGNWVATGVNIPLTPNVWHTFKIEYSWNTASQTLTRIAFTFDGTRSVLSSNLPALSQAWADGTLCELRLNTTASGQQISVWFKNLSFTYG